METSGPLIVELKNYLADPTSKEALEDCKSIAASFKKTSCLIVKDPRVSEEQNQKFLDMMEKYYDQPLEEKMRDVHPELSYQLGATPEFVEVPRDHTDRIKKLDMKNAAHLPKGADPKWRYFWRIGDRPKDTKFPELNAPPVIPKSFPDWEKVMNNWGELMMGAINIVSEMVAIGLGLPADAFSSRMKNAPHLLAPTGSNLGKFHELETIFAGYHYDLNFMTIHGKSRFPGLYIWLRDGTKVLVRVPDGCLLIQAGMQMEYMTGGDVTAGYHEVIVCPETLVALEKAKAENRSCWRVSSTLFSHIASDQELKPLGDFATKEALEKYPPVVTGKQVEWELQQIALAAPK